jgi:hypothetical protein
MASPRKRRLSPKARRTLVLLANNPFGVNEDLLVIGHGFSRGMTAGLIRAGFVLRYRLPLEHFPLVLNREDSQGVVNERVWPR